MDIRSGLDGLKALLGVTPAAPASAERVRNGQPAGDTLSSDRATLSNAGSEVAQTAAEGAVRTDKVAEIQAKLAAGTYDIPVSAVAAKVVDAMLGRNQ